MSYGRSEIEEARAEIRVCERDVKRQERYVFEAEARVRDADEFLAWAEPRLELHVQAMADDEDSTLGFSGELSLRMAILEVREERRRANSNLVAEEEERVANVEALPGLRERLEELLAGSPAEQKES
jgi:chromosome segregation ATPase